MSAGRICGICPGGRDGEQEEEEEEEKEEEALEGVVEALECDTAEAEAEPEEDKILHEDLPCCAHAGGLWHRVRLYFIAYSLENEDPPFDVGCVLPVTASRDECKWLPAYNMRHVYPTGHLVHEAFAENARGQRRHDVRHPCRHDGRHPLIQEAVLRRLSESRSLVYDFLVILMLQLIELVDAGYVHIVINVPCAQGRHRSLRTRTASS